MLSGSAKASIDDGKKGKRGDAAEKVRATHLPLLFPFCEVFFFLFLRKMHKLRFSRAFSTICVSEEVLENKLRTGDLHFLSP